MNELKVGILTLSAIASFIVLSLKITSNQSGFGEYVPYKTIVHDAAGIFPRTPIKVAGINSGRIKKIELAGNNQAVIEFEVLEDVKISKNSVLKIKTVGFLGDKYLEVQIGEGKQRLAPNSMIPSDTGGGIEDLTKDASQILSDLKTIMGSLKDTIVPKEKESPLKIAMDNITEITRDVKHLAKSLKNVVSNNEAKLVKLIDNLEKATSNMEYQLNAKNSDSLLTDLKKIGPVLDDAKEMTNDLKVIVGDLKAGKGTVGKLLRDDQVIDQVSETLSGVQKIVNKVDAIQTELGIFSSVNTEGFNRSDFSLSIFPSPERFYLLGVSTSEIGIEKEKEIFTRENGGVENVESRREVDKNTFTFNIQIGRRIQNWSFRVGLIESSGGFGIDYFVPSWSSYFTMEVFDYDKDLGPNLRLLSQIHLWNVFYGNIGFEDLVSKRDEQSFTIGAGLRFTDEDLKGLIGFLL